MSEAANIQTENQPDRPVFQAFKTLRTEIQQHIIGQADLVDRLLIALLADGHLLVEGAPGLAKTTAIKELAQRIEGDFHRLQFTPDLLPADLTGTDILGTLCVGLAVGEAVHTRTFRLSGQRDQMRQMSVITALNLLRGVLTGDA